MAIHSVNPPSKQFVQIEAELSFFSGQIVDSNSVPYGTREDEFKNRVLREFLIDCGVPAVATGAYHNDDTIPTKGAFYEGLAHIWGSIGFHYGHILRPVQGKVASIAQFSPVPTIRGRPIVLRRVTIDTTNHGNVMNRLEMIDPLRPTTDV